MRVKRHVITTPSDLYLTPDTPIYINRVSESFELAEHNHEFMEINYVSEGSGFHHIEGQTLPVTKGDLFFLPIGVSHVFRPAFAQPKRQHLIVYNCLFGEVFTRKLTDFFADEGEILRVLTAPYPDSPWFHWKDRDGTFQTMINTLFEEFVRKRSDYLLMMQTEMIRLLAHMHRSRSWTAASEHSASTEDMLEQVLQLIREQISEPPHITQLATMAGLSERQFRRRFVTRTGMNYTQFVHKLRIEMCCELLTSTNEKVSSIARRVGYQDIKFFNRLFKEKTGMTPRQYRNRVKSV